uniref:Ig-like domain-containing protein n=1 Tax=Amphilophus citrinellus TaxID=61819 RepID=A0A3Q0RZ19_AMPCI
MQLTGPALYFISSFHSTQPRAPVTLVVMRWQGEEDAKIICSHSISGYDQILWYKQSQKQVQLLGYTRFDKSFPETGVNVVMDGDARQNQKCTLTIKEPKLNSSGVYFCAASYHSAAHHCTSIQKPPKHIILLSILHYVLIIVVTPLLCLLNSH